MRYLLLILILIAHLGVAQSTNELLQELDREFTNREKYAAEKVSRIQAQKSLLRNAGKKQQYQIYLNIYDEYKNFIYDSAFLYARKLQQLAGELQNEQLVSHAKIQTGFVLVSAGMFNEALDTLTSVKTKVLRDSVKPDFYYIMARTCYDLADFNRDDYYRKIYTGRAQLYLDSALRILPPGAFQYLLMRGLRDLHLRNMDAAQKSYEALLNFKNISDPQYAIAASTLSFIYFNTGREELAREMLIRAAIADIRSCTKETLAILKLSELLFKEGDTERAYDYIKIAMEDADFYGARQRKTQVGAVFPMIEGRQLLAIESKRKTWATYSVLITVGALIVAGFSIVIYKQNKKLDHARKIISKSNESLTEANHQLQDANKIKEEYIWYYFNTTAEYITRLDALKKSLDLKLMTKKMEELRFTVDSINIKRERDELYHNFDKVFLKLFPDFVTIFNSMFKEEDHMVLKEGQLLNTELRIFALIRMGIHDHERIAKILDYSVTTIYTYKTRIRNKSLLPNDEFDKRIMSVKAI